MIEIIKRIAELQTQYSSKSTPAMDERGDLIRKALPEALEIHRQNFAQSLGRFGSDIGFQGKDGIGNKTPAPWVRIFSKKLSPKPTIGYYLVVHFSVDGESCFVTLGCSASRWNNDKGDFENYSKAEVQGKVDWMLSVFEKKGIDTSSFPDQIAIGSDKPRPKSFERATALCKTFPIKTITEKEFVSSIAAALELLTVIYEEYDQSKDQPASQVNQLEIEGLINPDKTEKIYAMGQGRGLNTEEKKAVELRAMMITRTHLEALGYLVEDTSANHPFDFFAKKGHESLKVEVKGTTSEIVDSVLMTSNEVDLHTREKGKTALSIVKGITLKNRDKSLVCGGGEMEFFNPWDISDWIAIPKAYLVKRR